MNIETNIVGNNAVLQPVGDVDLQNSPTLRKTLLELLGKRHDVIVDMSQIGYIDSSGIASLVEAYQFGRKKDLRFILANVSPTAMRVLKLARLDQIFTIRDDVDSALGEGAR